MSLILLLLFFFSGLATLVYEVTWLKLLAGSLSNSSHALSVVLAGFLLGLAMGARESGRRVAFLSRPLRAYAWMEVCIALAAVAMPYVLRAVSEAALSPLPSAFAHLLRLAMCGLLMFLVTLPIGATFPLQVASFRPTPQMARRASGFILGFQTAGGMSGVLLSGFLWLPAYGILSTHFLAVCLSALVAAAAFVMSIREPERVKVPPLRPRTVQTVKKLNFYTLCGIAGLVGGTSLALEVFYTRILTFFLPDLAWSFSAMLGVYLLALAIGAFAATRLAPHWSSLTGAGVVAMVGGTLAMCSLLVIPFLYRILHFFEEPSGGFEGVSFAMAAFVGSFVLVAPAAAALALFLPLCIGLLAPDHGSSTSAGAAFSANSIGSAAGALLAGMVLVPTLGIKIGVLLVGGLSLAAGVTLFALGLRLKRPRTQEWLVAGVCGLATVLCLWQGSVSRPLILDSKVFQSNLSKKLGRRLLEVREGSVTVASVVEEQGRKVLFNDAFQAAGTGQDYRYMKMLGHLPMLLAPNPKNALVIAFGTGTTAGSVSLHPVLEKLTLVEISPEVLQLAPYFEDVNFGLPEQVREGLECQVEVDDGRAFLRRSRESFDVITLEPLMPNTPAASHFYTREFFALAASRLAQQGVLCHWIPMHGQPLNSLKSILKSFASVFEDCEVFLFGSNAVLLGWKQLRPRLDYEEFDRRLQEPAVRVDLQRAGLEFGEQILGSFVAEGDHLRRETENVEYVTDDRPGILYTSIRPNIEHLLYRIEGTQFLLAMAEVAAPWTRELSQDLVTRLQVARQALMRVQQDELLSYEQMYRNYHAALKARASSTEGLTDG